MIAMTKFDISYAYPFTFLGFISVMILSHFLFDEELNIYKIFGSIVIIMGLYIISKGMK
jgi:multidrug transporter EmrE-like cation transporter